MTTRPFGCFAGGTDAPRHDHFRALVAVLAASHAYAIAGTSADWSPLAWFVPGLLLVGLAGVSPLRAAFYGVLFGIATGVHFLESTETADASLIAVTPAALLAAAAATTSKLFLGAMPFGLLAAVYASRVARTPAAARSSLAAWLWVGAELLHAVAAPEAPWVRLGESQHGSNLLVSGGFVLSFEIALVSTAVAEALRQRTSVTWGPRMVARWGALPASALVALAILGASLPPEVRSSRVLAPPAASETAAGPSRAADALRTGPPSTSGPALTPI